MPKISVYPTDRIDSGLDAIPPGQYLAFIYAYSKLNRRPPAEADMQRFFEVTAPSVHKMILTLERKGFISRQAGISRSITVLLSPELLPVLK